MNDVVGRKIKEGDMVLLAKAVSHGGELSKGIVLKLFKDTTWQNQGDLIKIVTVKPYGEMRTGKPGNTFPNRIVVIDNMPAAEQKILIETYNVYKEKK